MLLFFLWFSYHGFLKIIHNSHMLIPEHNLNRAIWGGACEVEGTPSPRTLPYLTLQVLYPTVPYRNTCPYYDSSKHLIHSSRRKWNIAEWNKHDFNLDRLISEWMHLSFILNTAVIQNKKI